MDIHTQNALATYLLALSLLQQQGKVHVTREIFQVKDRLNKEFDIDVRE
jgi:hypothetical protein